MKNRQNEQHINSQDRLTSLLKKEMPDAPQVVRFDPSVFLKSKVLLPDVSKQNMNSPQSSTSFSKESIIALVATNNIKRVFHSRTLSIASQLPPNEPSFALPTPTKASLANTNVIDISETGSNNDFQTTMYSSMVSNKKREISRLLIIPQRTTSAQKHSPSMKSHKNSVELDLPKTERPQTAQNNPVQDNYKKTLGSFFTLFDKNRTIEKPAAGQPKRLFAAFSSQPASPVSKQADSAEKEKAKPQRPLAIKPTEALNFGVLKLSETPLSNRSKRNLKISTPSSSHKPGKTPSPKHQSVEDSTKGPESGKLQSSENITRTNSGVTSEVSSVKKEEPYTVSKIELPESQIRIGRNNSKIEVGSSKSLQRKNTNEHKEGFTISKIELPETPRIGRNNSKIEVGSSKSLPRKNSNEHKGSKTIFNEEDKNKVKKVEDNHLLKIQPGAIVKLHKQNSIDLTLQNSTKPTSPREVHKDKVRQADPAAKDANTNSMSNTLLTKQGTLDSQNQKNDTSQAPTKRPIHDFLAETPKEPNSANVPGAEGEKEKKMNDIKMQRRSSFGEVFSLIQKQQITRRNSSYRNLAGLPGGNLLQNLFPESKKNETEPENIGMNIGTFKKRHSLINMTLPVKLKIALPSDDNTTTQGGGESTPKHGTPKHIKIITPHNLHIDLGVFSTAVSPKNRMKSQKEGKSNSPTKAINIELEGNQSSITSQYTNSADASRSGFSPLVDSMTPSPVQDKNRLGLPRLSLNGLSPCFSDRSAQLNHGGHPSEPVGKKGKKSFAQVCKQVIDIRRSHKSRMPTAIDTKGEGNRKSKENEVMSAGDKNKRRLSKTSELIMVGLPSSPGGTVREYGSFRTARAAEDYISGRKKVAFSNKESSIRELSLLRSIIKDNEEVTKKEKRSSNKGYSLFGGNNKLKTPGEGKGPKGSLSKSDPASPRESNSDIPASATSLQPPTSSRSSISFKKPKFTKTFSQKSVFAKKKGEFKKIQSNNFVVKFPKKEGETESNLKLNFKSKQKRREYHKTETIRKDVKPEGREELSKIFLGNLNRADRNNLKSPNLDKIKSENFVFNEGLDKQKTIDFSTLLQNDDDESIKAYPMRSISRTGSYRSDNSKIIMLSHRDRERDNGNTKLVIKITAPKSEGNVNLLAKPKGANDEELPEGCKKFEYITKSKRKRNIDAEIEFSPFDGLDDMNDYVYNDDTYTGDSLEIARAGFNWAEQAKYFSKAEQHGKFLRFFDTLCHKNTPYFAKSFEDVSARYIKENFNDRCHKQIFNKKLVLRLINPISTKMQDIYRNEDDEGEIALFNSTLVGKCYAKSEIFIKSCESVEDFLDDIKDYNVDLALELRGVPYLRPKARKALKGPHGHKHLLSQIDDRVQMKVFEEMRPTIEDYIMLNGVNMKEISRKEVYPQITKVLEKTSIKNSDYISKLNFLAYRELLIGELQSMYYIKSFDIKLLKDFIQDDGSTNQKAMVSTRKIIRNPSVMKLPPKGNSESQEPQRKGASLLRSAVEKMNIEREKTKLKLVKDESVEANKSDLDDSSDNDRTIINSILKRKNKKLVPLTMLNPDNKPFSAPASPNRTPDRVNLSDQEDQLNYSRSSLIVSRGRKEGLKSPNSGTLKKLPETTQQPKSLLWKTITTNNAHLSHSPSRFKQVVIDVMKKKSEEKKQMTQTNIPSMTKLNESRMSQQLPTPRKGSHHIKFDDKKTISTDETKMDKGALRMRTQAQTHTKKKNFTISQHIFWAVQENREAELRELFVFCPLSLLDKTDENGDNLLGIASQCGFTTIFNMLLDKGVNVNIPNANGDTPLHLALAYGNYDIADKLLALGARQNIPNKDGKFPWDLAR